jgi:hypothetical protein
VRPQPRFGSPPSASEGPGPSRPCVSPRAVPTSSSGRAARTSAILGRFASTRHTQRPLVHTAARRNPSPAILWSEGGRLERTCSGVDPFAGHIRMTQSAWHLKLPPAAANTLAPERIRILRSHTLASWRTRMLIDRTLASGRTRMLIDRTLASGRTRTLTARRACGTFVTAD